MARNLSDMELSYCVVGLMNGLVPGERVELHAVGRLVLVQS